MSSCEKPVEKGEFGNPLIKFYGDALADVGSSIAISDNGFVICGSITLMDRITNESGGREIVLGSEHKDMGVIITDKKGVQQNIINIGSPGVEDIGRKVISYNGSFYCLGTATVEHAGIPDRDVVVARIDGQGQLLDTWFIGDQYNQFAFDIIPNNTNSGFIICGASASGISGELDLKVWEVSMDGTVGETYLRGFEGVDDKAIRIINDHNGGYIVAGSTYELPGSVLGNNYQYNTD
ncbi:MAG: hypothetical protein R2744_13290 [Bacteroidales bacterium]